MRALALPGLLLLLPALVPASAQAAAPQLQLSLPVTFDFVTADRPETIEAQLTITFPSDASCGEPLAWNVTVAKKSENVTVNLESASGSVPVQAGTTSTRDFRATLTVDARAFAYQRIDVTLRAQTAACGNLEAASTQSQTGAKVGFVPRIKLEKIRETEQAWEVLATNLGNAAIRLDWIVKQPANGTVLSGAQNEIRGPERGPDLTTRIFASRHRFDPDFDVVLNATIVYNGNYAAGPDERPALGWGELTIYEAPREPPASKQFGQYALLGGAILLVAAAVVGAWYWKRRRL